MADAFSDYLGVTPPPVPGVMPAPELTPPKMGFADVLAGAFGAGPDRMGAYQKGVEAGGQLRLRSAQTESAMAEAEKRRAEALRQTQINDMIAKAQNNPNWQPSVTDLLTISTGANDFSTGRLHDQEFGFRNTLADPNAAAPAQFAAGQGVQGKVMPRMYDVGGETVNQVTDPNTTFQTPAQQAKVAADVALTGQRDRSPVVGGSAGVGGWKTVTVGGRRLRERTNPDTGEYEYEYVTDPTMLGRERQMSERVRTAAENSVDALENISSMKFGASTGVMGIGGSPGASMMEATKNALRNSLSDDDVRLYTAAHAGLNRSLAVLESSGLAPSGAFTDTFNTLAWRAGDTEFDRLYKVAEMRQTVDNAIATALTNPAISPEMRQQLEGLQQRVSAVIPFSPRDILALQASPTESTLAQVVARRGLQAKQPSTPSQPAAAAPVEGQKSKSNSGKPITFLNGGWVYD